MFRLMPAEMDKHKPYFSALFSALVFIPFFHMTGAYSLATPQPPCPGALSDTLMGDEATADEMPSATEIVKQDNTSSLEEGHAAPLCPERSVPLL